MWFKEILLITFQFCRLGECNWNDKAGERLRDFHVIVRMVCFHRFLIKTALSGLFGGSFCLSQLLHHGLRRARGREAPSRPKSGAGGACPGVAWPAGLGAGHPPPGRGWASIGGERCHSPRKENDWLPVTSLSLEEALLKGDTGASADKMEAEVAVGSGSSDS